MSSVYQKGRQGSTIVDGGSRLAVYHIHVLEYHYMLKVVWIIVVKVG